MLEPPRSSSYRDVFVSIVIILIPSPLTPLTVYRTVCPETHHQFTLVWCAYTNTYSITYNPDLNFWKQNCLSINCIKSGCKGLTSGKIVLCILFSSSVMSKSPKGFTTTKKNLIFTTRKKNLKTQIHRDPSCSWKQDQLFYHLHLLFKKVPWLWKCPFAPYRHVPCARMFCPWWSNHCGQGCERYSTRVMNKSCIFSKWTFRESVNRITVQLDLGTDRTG